MERVHGNHFSIEATKLTGITHCLQAEFGIPDADEGMTILALLDMSIDGREGRVAWQHGLDRGSVVELAELAERILTGKW